jgi:hypothetical protein
MLAGRVDLPCERSARGFRRLVVVKSKTQCRPLPFLTVILAVVRSSDFSRSSGTKVEGASCSLSVFRPFKGERVFQPVAVRLLSYVQTRPVDLFFRS